MTEKDTNQQARDRARQTVADGEKSLDVANRDQHLAESLSTSLSFSYAYKKTEKIAAALYLMSDNLPDSEPLKQQLRRSVLDLLSAISNSRPVDGPGRSPARDRAGELIMRLISLLDIGRFATLFSDMNVTVLIRELKGLYQHLTEKTLTESRPSFGADFLTVASPPTDSSVPAGGFSDGGGYSPAGRVPTPSVAGSSGPSPATGEGSKAVSNGRRKGRISDQEAAVNRTERRAIILSLVKKEGAITVRDVASLVSGCSRKTLQRELLSLVDEGVLSKEGERRWSKYSLAR